MREPGSGRHVLRSLREADGGVGGSTVGQVSDQGSAAGFVGILRDSDVCPRAGERQEPIFT